MAQLLVRNLGDDVKDERAGNAVMIADTAPSPQATIATRNTRPFDDRPLPLVDPRSA
jgi:hypothetical protein